MFCSKCGTEIQEGALFCLKCGAKLNSDVAPVNNSVIEQKNKTASNETTKELIAALLDLFKSIGGFIVTIVVIIVVGLIIYKNNPQLFSGVTDQVSNVVQKDDSNILAVKSACPYDYPNITYEQAFSAFFTTTTWKYFVGEQDGPDENGDGKPDYTKSDIEIVEFTGYCNYQDTNVKARIQFVLDKDNGTLSPSHLSLNDVPQGYLMLVALINKAFTEYQNN